MENSENSEIKVAIVGAGAAGLTAAEALRKKGYKHITVFERSDRAGGKCSTVEIEGKLYELGAGVISSANELVLRLAKEFNVPLKQANFGGSMLVNPKTGESLPKETLAQKFKLFRQVFFKYRKLSKKYQSVAEPGLTHIPSELATPFNEWAKEQNIEYLADYLAPFFTGYGYGYFEDISAAYVLKYYSWAIVQGFVRKQMFTFPEGIQHLWTAVSEKHNVRYNSTIEYIDRTDGVTLTVNGEKLEFDKLIITSPLDEALEVLDASKLEEELFSKIQYIDYRTYACEVEGIPKMSGYLPGNYESDQMGQPVFWYNRHVDTNVYTFYIVGDWKLTDEHALENISTLIEKMGGKMTGVHMNVHWKYFAHVSPQEMKDGYFDTLEGMQGKQNTFYAGELLNFSTVGLTSAYAEQLVGSYF